jgi:hypothetical protein
VKLWELSTNRSLIAYTGAGATGKQEFTTQAIFNHTEEFVMYPDEATVSLCVWDARTASRQSLLSLGKPGSMFNRSLNKPSAASNDWIPNIPIIQASFSTFCTKLFY